MHRPVLSLTVGTAGIMATRTDGVLRKRGYQTSESTGAIKVPIRRQTVNDEQNAHGQRHPPSITTPREYVSMVDGRLLRQSLAAGPK